MWWKSCAQKKPNTTLAPSTKSPSSLCVCVSVATAVMCGCVSVCIYDCLRICAHAYVFVLVCGEQFRRAATQSFTRARMLAFHRFCVRTMRWKKTIQHPRTQCESYPPSTLRNPTEPHGTNVGGRWAVRSERIFRLRTLFGRRSLRCWRPRISRMCLCVCRGSTTLIR